ncbi:MAG: AMP-binding protein [Bacteroidetes bacterium]|nr:AMP-binding protein [Bacteroidota bacterium]
MSKNRNILAHRIQYSFQKYSDNIAISIGDNTLTYSAMQMMATSISNAIAAAQQNLTIPVAILGAKSFLTFSGIVASLFASHAYMPLNLKFPVSRNRKMLALSGAKVIVADSHSETMLKQLLEEKDTSYYVILEQLNPILEKEFPQHHFLAIHHFQELGNREILSKGQDTAYLLFTSGTTGSPKGVPVSNDNVCVYMDHVLAGWSFNENDRFSQTFDLTFDLSVHDMMLCWLSGACLCIPEDESPFRLASYIRDQKLSVWFSVPSAAILMDKMRLLKEDAFNGLRLSFFCGEALPETIAGKWLKAVHGRDIVNLYGPAEATIAIGAYAWDNENKKSKNGVVCLGKIFEEQEYCLIDPDTIELRSGKGELCLAGKQIIGGYLNDQELSDKYFVHVRGSEDQTWYRTGDMVEEDGDGDLFFMGRRDAEVKISGYRVNLFEIDALIRQTAGTELVASILDDRKTARILTFISGGSIQDEHEIILRCREELPWYMIPEVIIFVDEMPMNVNGKIDRNKLKQKLHDQ